jgi:peptidoglycan-associated lipoprotein
MNGGAIDGSNLGDPSNPASPAYFNQTVGDRVWFVVDQSTLTDQARATLDGQARWLSANPQYAIIVEGHADEQGTREYNLALGARRASAVQQYLISQGVGPNRIQTVTYGKERPIAVCSDETCYAQNRRAVTVLQAGSGV